MFEYNPFRIDVADPERIYRGVNTTNPQSKPDKDAVFLGSAQMRWIKQSLLRSRSTWKIIASDMPISIVVRDLNPDVTTGTFEGWANADHGKPSGRERKVAELLCFIKRHNIKNVVSVDVQTED